MLFFRSQLVQCCLDFLLSFKFLKIVHRFDEEKSLIDHAVSAVLRMLLPHLGDLLIFRVGMDRVVAVKGGVKLETRNSNLLDSHDVDPLLRYDEEIIAGLR